MKTFLILSALFLINPPNRDTSDQVLGYWMSEGKDLKVEVFKVKDRYAARIVWFECDEATPRPMVAHRDRENPDSRLRKRSWLGMVVVNDLKFDRQKNEWSGGNIYDPNSGHTFNSVARLVSPQEMVVRGYWSFEFLGKSLHFRRVVKQDKNVVLNRAIQKLRYTEGSRSRQYANKQHFESSLYGRLTRSFALEITKNEKANDC